MAIINRRLMLLALVGFCAKAFSADVDCLKVLEAGRLTTTSRDYSIAYSNYYNAFCSTQIQTQNQASQRAAQFGIQLEELPLSFEGSDRSSDARSYFSKLCQSLRADSGSLNDFRRRIESLDSRIHQSFEACIGRPGVHSWAQSDLGELGDIRLFLKYVKPVDVGPSSIVLGRTFGTTPRDAFSECSHGAFEKGQVIDSLQTSEAVCILNRKYKDRRSVAVTFNIVGLPPKTQQIVLPPRLEKREIVVTSPPPVQGEQKKKVRNSVLLIRHAGNQTSAPAGDWLEFPVGYTKFKTATPKYGSSSPLECDMKAELRLEGPDISILDEDDELRPWGLRVWLVNSDGPNLPPIAKRETSGRSSSATLNWASLAYEITPNCINSGIAKMAYVFGASGRQDVGVQILAQGRACQSSGVVRANSDVTVRPWPPGFDEPNGWNCQVKMRLCYYPSHPNYSKESECPSL